jgi:sialate O-acetylesterase
MRLLLAAVAFFGSSACALADIRLASPFTDHMVLQRNANVPVWGWGDPGERIEILASWGPRVRATVGSDRTWSARIRTGSAGGPHTLKFEAENTIELKDVLLGEVWLCSGQSNMEWTVGQVVGKAPEALRDTNMPRVRLFQVPNKRAPEPQKTADARWVACSADSAKGFSAVGFFFAKHLLSQLGDVPIGLIQSDWGGTEAEVWLSAEAYRLIPGMPARTAPQWAAGELYNGMIAPLIPFAIKGALWYQGESNVGRAEQYRDLFTGLIKSWRADWMQGDFPFYFAQIAPWSGYRTGKSALLREAQLQTLSLKNTGMIVTTDITDNVDDIHPVNKWDVGRRFALLALNRLYGKNQVDSGPIFRSHKVEGDKIRVFFDPQESELVMQSFSLPGLEIAGEDGKWVMAQSRVDGNALIVYSQEVPKPVAVRYGWSDVPKPGLANAAGLPASPFRTK